jgi:copper homeostasis protein
LHRAFDLVPDWQEAIDIAVQSGFDRILTSGGKATAIDGVAELEEIITLASGRISIMPGSGIKAQNIGQLIPRLAIAEVHASCSLPVIQPNQQLINLGFSPDTQKQTDAATVGALKAMLV